MSIRRYVSAGLVAVLAGATLAGAAGAQEGKAAAPVARVGSTAVSREDLRRHLMTYFGRNALEQMANRVALTQEAARLKVAVSDADLKARLAELRKNTDVEAALKNTGLTDETWQDQVRTGMLAEKVLDAKWPVKPDDLVRMRVTYARYDNERAARDCIRQAKQGVSFDVLAGQSLSKEERYVSEKPFLRVEHPSYFKIAWDALLRVGQVTPEPVRADRFWLVVKLEERLGAETLNGKARENAVNMVRASRMPKLLPTLRRRYPAEFPVPPTRLIAEASLPKSTVVLKVLADETDLGEYTSFMMENYGQNALEQLTERRIMDQLAAQARVAVSDAEVTGRLAAVKKQTGESTFQKALVAEGITEEAWKERVRYTYLAEKVVNARMPVPPEELVRYTARYIRVGSAQEAQQVLQALRGGAKFETAQAQVSLDRGGDGFLKPRAFLRVEQPELFKKLADANVPNGQVLPQPLEVGGSFLVLKVEARLGPETMTGKERDDAIRRINALRLGTVLDELRKEVPVEVLVPMKTLIAEAKA